MGTFSPMTKRCAFTLIELLVVVAIIAFFVAMLLPAHTGPNRSYRSACINHQRQIGIALIMFHEDHGGHFPWQLSVTNGGSLEVLPWGNVSSHFRAGVSQYLGTNAQIYICPSDRKKYAASNSATIGDENISYFLNLDVLTSVASNSVLTGDRNLAVKGSAVQRGLLTLSTNLDLNWNREQLHHSGGILAFADGHADFVRTNQLSVILRDCAMATNRLCVP